MAGLSDLARMTSTTVGTGTITLGTAVTPYLTFDLSGLSTAAVGVVIDYGIQDVSASEIGTGTYTSSSLTLTRTPTKSTNGNAAIAMSGGAQVFVTPRAETLNNAALFTGGTLNVVTINGGTANQFVQGDGSFQTQGRKLLNTLNVSSAATASDVTSLTSSFSDYEIVFENIIPSATTGPLNLEFQVHSGGTFQATSYVTQAIAISNNSASFAGATTFIQIGASQGPGSPGISGTLRLFGPVNTTSNLKQFNGAISGQSSGPLSVLLNIAGYWNNTAAIDGFQILYNSSNITSGIVKVYGLN